MKIAIAGIFAVAATAFAVQTVSSQAPANMIKVRGCLQGEGSDASPWAMRRVTLPAPPAPPAAAPAGRGAAPAGGGRGGAGGGGGRGGDGGRGAAPAAAPAPPPPPPVDLRLTGVDMTPWRNLFIEVEGTLGPAPAGGLREFRVMAARTAYGDCR